MILFLFLIISLFSFVPVAANAQQAVTKSVIVEVENPWNQAKQDEPVVLSLESLNPSFRVRSALVMNGSEEIPSQLDDLDEDMKADELVFVLNLPPHSVQKLTITLSSAKSDKRYPARVYAQMKMRAIPKYKHQHAQSITVPGESNIYNLMYHHGPIFESELVGYRIYFNQKQTIDPYGKFQKRLELEQCEFYPTEEQLAQGFGDDVLMVGNSGGVGALKGWNGKEATHIEPVAFRTERLLATGPIRTVAEVEVKGWEYQGKELTMTHRYILYAGHRDLLIETRFDEPLEDEVFCAGVQSVKGTETVSDSDHQGLVGSWGRHWPVTDTVRFAKETVGLATYIPKKFVYQEVSDKDNFLYTIKAPGSKTFHYYTMFTSRKETFGPTTSKEWFEEMRRWKQSIEQPIRVRIVE